MSLEKIAHAVSGLYNGVIIQLTSISFVLFGIEMDLELIFIAIGVMFSGIGLLITWRSAKTQNIANQLEIQVKQKELEELALQREIFKKEHPEFFDTNEQK